MNSGFVDTIWRKS